MTKKRSIISFDKLTIDQKKQVLKDFPDGYINHLTSITTPTGEKAEAFVWETDEIIYLVKVNKIATRPSVDDDDDDDYDDDELGFDSKGDDLESDDDEEDDDYDKAEDDGDDDED